MTRALLAAAALALALPSAAAAETTAAVETDTLRLVFSARGARPIHWSACHPDCASATAEVSFGDPPNARLGARDAGLDARLAALPYRVRREEGDAAVRLHFVSDPLDGVRLEQHWRVPKAGYGVEWSLDVRGEGAEAFARGLVFRVETGDAFRPPPAAGFEALSSQVRPVVLEGWSGMRRRFWVLAADREEATPLAAETGLHLYAGPVQVEALRAADPELTRLLFSGRWFWMRWLCFGLLWLLDGLIALLRVPGIAIIALALVVKTLMLPLTRLAQRLQRDVNQKRTRLQPALDQIKRTSRGGERSERVLALYKEHGVHPLFGLKSLLGVAVQIPVFIAAYHMLDENFDLLGVGFLWIRDLASPDRLATLPFRIPFFGSDFNLLPFVMTAATLLSSWSHDDGSLSEDLLRSQRRSLYLMAGLFFLLFYTFPAGMVLYWTSNNLIGFAKDRITQARSDT